MQYNFKNVPWGGLAVPFILSTTLAACGGTGSGEAGCGDAGCAEAPGCGAALASTVASVPLDGSQSAEGAGKVSGVGAAASAGA